MTTDKRSVKRRGLLTRIMDKLYYRIVKWYVYGGTE